jgi:ssDNA thymidine ADP-ribosyltransferase, DarT
VTAPPSQPKVYHITHVDNLAKIVADGGLVSDRRMIERGGPVQTIGMSAIKRRRVEELGVACHPGTKVGDYVPFYFCPRSIMLYVIYCANHPDLTYREGQDSIIHLESDLYRVIQWAEANDIRWAFSLSNAGAFYTEFCSTVDDLVQLDWTAIEATDFKAPEVKEGKQAEFLLYDLFPFDLVERIGVRSVSMRATVAAAIQHANHQPRIDVRPEWYF